MNERPIETICSLIARATAMEEAVYFRSYNEGVGFVWLGDDVFELRDQDGVFLIRLQNAEHILIPGVEVADIIISGYNSARVSDELMYQSREAVVSSTLSRIKALVEP